MKKRNPQPPLNRYLCLGFARSTDKSPLIRYESYSYQPVEALSAFGEHLRMVGKAEQVKVWRIEEMPKPATDFVLPATGTIPRF